MDFILIIIVIIAVMLGYKACYLMIYKFINKVSPSLGNKITKSRKDEAKNLEEIGDYAGAIDNYNMIGDSQNAKRVMELKKSEEKVKVSQKVVHGDEVTKTEIKDSVLNRSNVGAGSSKIQELEKLAEMKKEGLISDEEYKKMKQEIIG